MAEAVLHLHEYLDEAALVLPAPANTDVGMTVRSPVGDRYRVVRCDVGTDRDTGEVVQVSWECLPV